MAPPPSPRTVQTALQALRDDATCWRSDAVELRNGAQAAGDQMLDPSAFSGLGQAIGYPEVYHRLVARVAALFRGGAANFDAVAAALDTAAAGYEEDERDAVHRLKGQW